MKRGSRFFIAVLGLGIGPGVVYLVLMLLQSFNLFNYSGLDSMTLFYIYTASAVVGSLLLYGISLAIIESFIALYKWIERKIFEIPITDLIYGIIGLTVGLVISFFISSLISQIDIPVVPQVLSILIYIGLSVLGWTFAVKRRSDILAAGLFRRSPKEGREEKGSRRDKDFSAKPKILDTSVIIDGRIFDICQTGIVEGVIIIPEFVLQELRHVADSADGLKRNRGRRGLDVLNRIRKELDIPVRIVDKDYEDIHEVDSKLIHMAQEMSGVVVTNDYNLNKVAEVQNISVLNINELTNALKPILLPGEQMQASIVKDGKEAGQGVAYLDDGTMIVVEGGKKHVGEQCMLTVTSVLQTAAGRMIFAKLG